MIDAKESLLNDLTKEFTESLPTDVVEHIASLSSAGEWGVGLEELCNMVYEYDVPISKVQYEKMKELGRLMEMDSSTWDILDKFVS